MKQVLLRFTSFSALNFIYFVLIIEINKQIQFKKQEDHDGPYRSPAYLQERSTMKINTKYQSPRPNEYEKDKTRNFNRGLGP